MTQPNNIAKSSFQESWFEDIGRPTNPGWLERFVGNFSLRAGPRLSLSPEPNPGITYVTGTALAKSAKQSHGDIRGTRSTEQAQGRLMVDGILDEKLALGTVALRIIKISANPTRKNPETRLLSLLLMDADCPAYGGTLVRGEDNAVRISVLGKKKANVTNDPMLKVVLGPIDHPEIPLTDVFFDSLKNSTSNEEGQPELLLDPVGLMGRSLELDESLQA